MNPTAKTLRQWAGSAPTPALERGRTALLLIDFQEEYFDSGHLALPEAHRAIARARELLAWARSEGMAVIHVQHVAASPESPLFTPGSAQVALRPELTPLATEPVIQKALPSSFAGTSLHQTLAARGVRTLVLGGLMTHMCVSSTARAGVSFGYQVLVAADACASRDLPSPVTRQVLSHAILHEAALAGLADRFADVRPAAEVMGLRVCP